MQKLLQFVNMNKDKYSQLKRKVDDFLVNNTKVRNKELGERKRVIDDFWNIVEDINTNYMDIRLIRDTIQFSLEEVYP